MAQSFPEFFEWWLLEQRNSLEEHVQALLVQASNEEEESEEHVERVFVPLIEKGAEHYEHYYETKSRWAKQEVFAMLNPSWMSSFEDGFLWIGGWRPSMAFHLLYSKSGLQLEARMAQLLEGLHTNDLGELSAAQLHQIDELMAQHQETVADPSMVKLSHIASELIRGGPVENGLVEDNEVESTLAPKEAGLVEILQRADDFRLSTLKGVLQILNPIQSVHFLIAVADLHLRVHDWGKRRDVEHAAMRRQQEIAAAAT